MSYNRYLQKKITLQSTSTIFSYFPRNNYPWTFTIGFCFVPNEIALIEHITLPFLQHLKYVSKYLLTSGMRAFIFNLVQ